MKNRFTMFIQRLMGLSSVPRKEDEPKEEPKEASKSECPVPEFVAEDYDQIGTCGEDVRWGFKQKNGELTIIGTGDMQDYKYSHTNGIVAPWRQLEIRSISIYGVTSVGSYAFSDCKKLVEVTIGDGVTTIGRHAFSGCHNLAHISLGNGVITIGDHAFDGCCDGLTEITIPNSVTTIGAHAFSNCQDLTEIIIPENVTTIGDGAFSGCSSLTEVTIPVRTTSIGNDVFLNCGSLTDIHVNNASYMDVDGVLFTKDRKTLVQYPIGKNQASYSIPDGVTSIRSNAFNCCKILTEITIPVSVVSIEDCAFSFCCRLTNIHADSVSYVDVDGVLFTKDRKTLVQYPIGKAQTSYCIPDGVTSIGDHAFSRCYNLTKITIPDGVTSIGEDAFNCCHSLTEITIPDSVTSIEERAFSYCKSLTEITIPDGVTSIEEWTFCDCERLTKISIPDSVTSINMCAFSGCNNLTKVYYSGTKIQWDSIGFNFANQKNVTIHFKR